MIPQTPARCTEPGSTAQEQQQQASSSPYDVYPNRPEQPQHVQIPLTSTTPSTASPTPTRCCLQINTPGWHVSTWPGLQAHFAAPPPPPALSPLLQHPGCPKTPDPNASPNPTWCTQASMSATYRRGSCAWISIGRGRPPGPPLVSATMKRWNSAPLRAAATCTQMHGDTYRRIQVRRYFGKSQLEEPPVARSSNLQKDARQHR